MWTVCTSVVLPELGPALLLPSRARAPSAVCC